MVPCLSLLLLCQAGEPELHLGMGRNMFIGGGERKGGGDH